MKNKIIDIDKIIKKINAESYSIEKSNANSALIKLLRSNKEIGKIIIVVDNPLHELLNSVLHYKTNYDKILWVYRNKEIKRIANDVNSLTGKEIIVPINILDN